jgi:hypothetical protein
MQDPRFNPQHQKKKTTRTNPFYSWRRTVHMGTFYRQQRNIYTQRPYMYSLLSPCYLHFSFIAGPWLVLKVRISTLLYSKYLGCRVTVIHNNEHVEELSASQKTKTSLFLGEHVLRVGKRLVKGWMKISFKV